MSRVAPISHPGPRALLRRHVVPGHAARIAPRLPAGHALMPAVAARMDELGCDSAVLFLDGLRMGPYAYVMPAEAPDDRHAAWYSSTHHGAGALLQRATAIIGRREGNWLLHCHAHWEENGRPRAGHLLPDQVQIAEDAHVSGFAFTGGVFDVVADEETNFSFFRPRPEGKPKGPINAALATLAPFEELTKVLPEIAFEQSLGTAQLYGIGSLIGAEFTDAPSMASPISEVLLLPGATTARMPMFCVDPAGDMFEGVLRNDGGPVCVTFEALLTAPDL